MALRAAGTSSACSASFTSVKEWLNWRKPSVRYNTSTPKANPNNTLIPERMASSSVASSTPPPTTSRPRQKTMLTVARIKDALNPVRKAGQRLTDQTGIGQWANLFNDERKNQYNEFHRSTSLLFHADTGTTMAPAIAICCQDNIIATGDFAIFCSLSG